MGLFHFTLVRRFWRLILGTALVGSGFSYLETNANSAYFTLALGAVFIVWHIISIIKTRSTVTRQDHQ